MIFCIDMKCFFASVECSMRMLNPLATPLVVSDSSKGKGALCLAVSPFMKSLGINSRTRIFDIDKNLKYFKAMPRMSKYMETTAKINSIFLRYVEEDSIHTYSVDESFLDVTKQLVKYDRPCDMAFKIMQDIKAELGIICCCGAGDNLYLAKLALDLKAKHETGGFYYLGLDDYFNSIWKINDLTEIWQIGRGISRRLNKMKIFTLEDIALSDKNLLSKEFGVIGLDLYEHAWGIDNTTIQDIKAYQPKTRSFSRGQILFRDYTKKEALTPLIEMIYLICLDLFAKEMLAGIISINIGYSNNEDGFKKSMRLDCYTNNFLILKNYFKQLYAKVSDDNFIRRISIGLSDLKGKNEVEHDLFFNPDLRYDYLCETILDVWEKYGKNSIVLGITCLRESTLYDRNKKIGGHNSD